MQMSFEQVCKTTPLAGIWATWRHSNTLQIFTHPFGIVFLMSTWWLHNLAERSFWYQGQWFNYTSKWLVVDNCWSGTISFHQTSQLEMGQITGAARMRSKLRLQRLKPSVASGASSTRCPKRCLKRRRSLWRKKSQFQRQELWGMRIFRWWFASMQLARSCTWEMWRFAVWSPNTRTSRSVGHEVQSHPAQRKCWSPKCSSRERHCPDQKDGGEKLRQCSKGKFPELVCFFSYRLTLILYKV